jgi:hypothetical protein
MAFCKVVEWPAEVDLGGFLAMLQSAGDLPAGCLGRVAGRTQTGVCLIELWRSADDARRVAAAQSSPAAEPPAMPAPTRVEGFDAPHFELRPGAD